MNLYKNVEMELKTLFSVLCCINLVHGYHILGLFPFQGRSHIMYSLSYIKILAKAGHEVTVVSHAPPLDNAPKNYHAIQLNKTLGTLDDFNFFKLKNAGIVQNIFTGWAIGEEMCQHNLAEPAVKELMKAKGKFDAVIVELFFDECFIAFAHVLDIPLIQTVAYAGAPFVSDLVGTPRPYSYVPDLFIGYSHPMNFWERIGNIFQSQIYNFARQWYYLPKLDKWAKINFEDPNLPPLSELELHTSLVFVNDHESISFTKPGMPNLVKVAGSHIPDLKPLPKELQKMLDEAKNGVIFFSLGSNLKTNHLPKEIQKSFVKIFSKLKQKVIWKWDADEPVPGKPENVILGKWFPQSDILRHPNLRLFITHGGLMSTLESLDRGVPIIGIPVFGDQPANMRYVEKLGFGMILELENITDSSLEWALNEILKPEYYEIAKMKSALFHDRPSTPQNTILWWVEHIIRNKGAKYLRSPGMDLTWYQYYMLDVLTFILGIFWIGTQILKNLLFRKENRQKKLKKN